MKSNVYQQLVNDVLGEDMEETYNKSAAFWQGLKRELAKALAEKAAYLRTAGIEEEDLDLSSEDEDEEEGGGLDKNGLDDDVEDSETESVTTRRR